MEQVGKKDKLKKKEILAAAVFFGLGKILSYSLIKKGNINSNYILKTASGKYVLRVYKFKSEKEILGELELLNFLSKKNFACPAPIGSIYKVANKFACCFEFIEGKEPKKITESLLREIARMISRMHILTKNYKTNYGREGEGLAVIKKYIESKKGLILASKFNNSKNFIHYLETEIEKITVGKNLPYGAVHIDVKSENIIEGKNKQLYFIDFDNFYFDALIMDVVSSVMWLCVEKDRVNFRKAKIFLSEYDKYRKITSAEEESFWDYTKFHCLKGAFKYAYICLPRLKFAEQWAYHFVRLYKNVSNQENNFKKLI